MRMLTTTALAVAIGFIPALAVSANAGTLSVIDRGTVNTAQTPYAYGSGMTVTSANNTQLVNGGGANNGTIATPTYTNTNSNNSSGWNPYGAGVSGQWLSIGGSSGTDSLGHTSSITFSLNAKGIEFVWGSSSGTNTVSLYGDNNSYLGKVYASGGSSLVVTDASNNVLNTINNGNLVNSTAGGAVIDIFSTVAIKSAVFSTAAGSGGFEIGKVSAVPIPAALPLFGTALIGLGALAKRRRRTVAEK